MANFVIKNATTHEYYFNLRSDNSQILLTSQIYSSRSACYNGIESVKNNCFNDSYDRKMSVDNKYYFVLRTINGQIIGNSEMFDTNSGMETGIDSVKHTGIDTKVVEEELKF